MENPHPETIPTCDIPFEQFWKAGASVFDYTVAFFRPIIPPSLLGTGVLALVDGKRFILTARHVADEIKEYDRIAVALSFGKKDFIPWVPISKNEIFTFGDGRHREEEGPDLSFIILPLGPMGSIAAQKSFFDIGKHKETSLAFAEKGLEEFSQHCYFLQGHPGERSLLSLDGHGATLSFRNYTLIVYPIDYQPAGDDGHDYLIFPADENEHSRTIDQRPIPTKKRLSSWGGMSGGGVWLLGLRRSDGKIEFVPPTLFGVCFYQWMRSGKVSHVKAHGPISIYETLYRKIEGLSLPS